MFWPGSPCHASRKTGIVLSEPHASLIVKIGIQAIPSLRKLPRAGLCVEQNAGIARCPELRSLETRGGVPGLIWYNTPDPINNDTG